MENFQTIKKKYLTVAIAASVVLGVCASVAVTSTLAVVLKRCGVNFFWAFYIPIALVLAAGFGGLFWLLLRPTDEKIAKKLDSEYGLNQKTQTMVEFAGVEGAMPALQREQANEALGEVAKKRVNLNWLWKFAFIPVLALAMLFVGIFVPAGKSLYDPPYDVTLIQEAELKKLIANVQASSLDDTVKTGETEILNSLLDTLHDAKQQSEMRAAVITAVAMTDSLIASSNSYLTVYKTFITSPAMTELSKAAVRGVIFYKSNSRITTFEAVQLQSLQATEAVRAAMEKWFNKVFLADYYTGRTSEEQGTPVPVETASANLSTYARQLTAVLGYSDLAAYMGGDGEEPSDAYCAALSEFAETLRNLSFKGDGRTAATYAADITAAGTSFINDCSIVLSSQSYACMMDEYIRNSLARIFGINVSDFGSNSNVAPERVDPDNEDDDPGNENPNEGYSPGGTKYGSDDMILNVDTALPEKYGKLLDDYNRKVKEFRTADCSEEMRIFIEQYFQLLYHGLDEDNN
ncbi:MAG: hypothetical protein K2O44_02270 [Clostridia bacterium]|nr:hypothetical protein [Clostridia bacterium]